MHAPAWTPFGATPGQSVLSRSSPTETPWAPAAITRSWSAGVYQAGLGRTGDEELAAAVEAGRRAAAHVTTSARRSLVRMTWFLPAGTIRGHADGVPHLDPYPPVPQLNGHVHAGRGPGADRLRLAGAVLARQPRRP